MIKGIGTDLIEIDRIKKAVLKESFTKKCYTINELNNFYYVDNINYNSLAGNFAGKEAVSKALGTGFSNVSLLDIEILRHPSGKPYVNLFGNAKLIADSLNINELLISISHNKTSASAFVIAQ